MTYQLQRDGQSFGPYTLDDLRRYLASGNVLADDLVKSEEMTGWLPVTQVLGPMALPAAPFTGYDAQALPYAGEVPQIASYPFFPVSVLKFALMSMCTFGLYHIYWAYKQWNRIGSQTGESMLVWARAIFLGIWNFSLFSRVHSAAELKGVAAGWNYIVLATLVVLLGVTYRLPEPWAMLALLSFLAYLPVIATIEKINVRSGPAEESPNRNFSAWNIVGLVIGLPLLLLSVLGSLLKIGQ
jgi:hypothetical protein